MLGAAAGLSSSRVVASRITVRHLHRQGARRSLLGSFLAILLACLCGLIYCGAGVTDLYHEAIFPWSSCSLHPGATSPPPPPPLGLAVQGS